MNEIQQKSMITSIVFSGIPVFATSVAMLVVMPATKENLLSFILLIIAALVIFIVFIVLLGGMAQLYKHSKQSLQTMKVVACRIQKQNAGGQENWRKKFLATCQPIKVMFGEINFVDSLTPLVCLDFSINLALQIVLIEA